MRVWCLAAAAAAALYIGPYTVLCSIRLPCMHTHTHMCVCVRRAERAESRVQHVPHRAEQSRAEQSRADCPHPHY
jgi:hypothetical protein